MDNVYLKKLNLEDAKEEYEFLSEFESENGFDNPVHNMDLYTFLNSFIPTREKYKKGINLPEGRVPDTYYLLWVDNKVVGLFKVRHYLNDRLKETSGHIGFGIKKECRRQGLGTIGLKLAIEELKKKDDFKEDEVYLSCLKDNIASYKTQLAVGAYLHHEDDKHYYLRVKVK